MNGHAWMLLAAAFALGACGTSEADKPVDLSVPGGAGSHVSETVVSVKTQPGTFVWLEPIFAHEFPPAEGAVYMDQQGQMFMPDTLLARTGQPVYFRSTDDVLHNVRVVRSDKTPIFNVATTPFGGHRHIFDEPGFYDVSCDIHTAMRATIYVSSTPHLAAADAQGRFVFEHVVPGAYTLFGFEDGRRVEKTVDVAGERVEFSLP